VDEALGHLGAAVIARAVRSWTGRGVVPRPTRDDASVVAELGEELALDALPIVHFCDEAFYESDAYQRVADLAEAGRVAAAEFRARFPDLPESVAEDLAWCYTYDYR
jgi:hypothetical protein